MWLRELFNEIGLDEAIREPTLTLGDNRAAILLSEEDIVSTGNQFITIPYHYNKEVIEEGAVTMQFIPTAHNIADLFTKAVNRQTLERLLPRLIGDDDDVTFIPNVILSETKLLQSNLG